MLELALERRLRGGLAARRLKHQRLVKRLKHGPARAQHVAVQQPPHQQLRARRLRLRLAALPYAEREVVPAAERAQNTTGLCNTNTLHKRVGFLVRGLGFGDVDTRELRLCTPLLICFYGTSARWQLL